MNYNQWNWTAEDHDAVVSEAVALLPGIATLTGCPHVCRSSIAGLVQSLAELRGVVLLQPDLGVLEAASADLLFPYSVELEEGPWFEEFPVFVRTHVSGLCTLVLLPFTDDDLPWDLPELRYAARFTCRTDAALFRLNYG